MSDNEVIQLIYFVQWFWLIMVIISVIIYTIVNIKKLHKIDDFLEN